MPPRARMPRAVPDKTTKPARPQPADRSQPPPDVAPQETIIDATPVGGPDEPPPVETRIEFRGRMLRAVMPDPAQLAVMQMTADRYANSASEFRSAKPEQVIRALQRAVTMLMGVFPDIDDREWLEDLMMRRELTLTGMSELLRQATDVLVNVAQEQQPEPTNRAGRRSAAGRKRPAHLVTDA